MWLLALIAAAVAAPTGYYHPDDLAQASQRFEEANAQAGGAFEAASKQATQLAQALKDYREALDLLGERAPAAERERLEALEKQFHRQRATLGAFLDTLLEDFDAEFTAARDRALASVGGEVMECRREIAEGPRVPGMRPRTKANPDCQGEDLNAELAGRMDADDQLKAALTEILALQWPTLELPAEPMAPVGGGERWVAVHTLMQQGARDTLKRIDREDDEARLPFEAALEQEQGPEALASHLQAARAVTAKTAAARASAAERVLGVAEARMSKVAGAGDVGWCANPPALGGCRGEDATDPLVSALLDDKKVRKALPR